MSFAAEIKLLRSFRGIVHACIAVRKPLDGRLAILNDAPTPRFGTDTSLMKTLLATLPLLFIAGPTMSAEPGSTGTFSSLRFGTEDLTGMEISVVFGGDEHYVIVQCAEGTPGVPEVVVARLLGKALSFQLSANTLSGCPTTKFSGTINSNGLTGSFDHSDWPGFLKRGKSYWQ